MPQNTNAVMILAAISQEPELRYTPGGMAVLEIQVAGDEPTVMNDGTTKNIPFYERITWLGKAAERKAEEGYKQGDVVLVEGRLKYREWEKEDGKKDSRVEIEGVNVNHALGYQTGQTFSTDAQGGKRLVGGYLRVYASGRIVKIYERNKADAPLNCRVKIETARPEVEDGKIKWKYDANWIGLTLWREDADFAASLGAEKLDFMGEFRLTRRAFESNGEKRQDTSLQPINIVYTSAPGGQAGTFTPTAFTPTPLAAYDAAATDDDNPF